jgi:hypothetical protein
VHESGRRRVLLDETQIGDHHRADSSASGGGRFECGDERVEQVGYALAVQRGAELVEAAEVVVQAAKAYPARRGQRLYGESRRALWTRSHRLRPVFSAINAGGHDR